ncbi:hypothetical protein NDA16_001348 [Ustilago loliicola]|nr:hypothetical protein NDA16_001348 [Ustilago loliicola]
MLLKQRFTAALGLSLLALQACLAQEPAQPSSTASVFGSTATPAPTNSSSTALPASTTVVSTITTTLSNGQSLPTSLTALASSSGSVYYIPVLTAIPVSSNATSTTASSSAAPSATGNATASALDKPTNTTLPLRTIIDPAFGVLGAILIISGLPMGFYGHRNRWSSYFLAGFFALALICISIILKVGVEPAVNPPSKAIRGLFLVAAMVAGAVGGIISIVFWRGAGLFACGLGGFFFGLFLQAVRPGGLVRPVGLRYILYIGLYAVFFTVSCIERVHALTLALATAVIGATAVTLGVDCYSTQGLKEFYVRNLGFDSLFSNKYPPTFQGGRFPLVQGMQIELGVLGALILMGFAFQMRLWSDLRTQLAVLKRSDEKRNMRSKAERAARAVARTAKRDLEQWEARHGYNKTATRNPASRDEEIGLPAVSTPDVKDSRSRTSSFMTLFRANTDVSQLATPMSHTEKLAESPAASSVLDNTAYPFPAQSSGRRSSQFLDYIQKGPERVEPEGPLKLDLPAITSPLTDFQASPVASPGPDAILMSSMYSAAPAAAPAPPSLSGSQHPKSLDLTRASSSDRFAITDSFRQRSASTAALMDNAASFLDPVSSKNEAGNITSNSSSIGSDGAKRLNNTVAHSQSPIAAPGSVTGMNTPGWTQSLESTSHERTFSNPSAPTAPAFAGATSMAKSHSHQGQLQNNIGALQVDPNAERRFVQPQQSPLASPTLAPVKTVSGGQSSAVMQARRSLATRRSDQPAVPWTNPGAETGTSAHKRAASAEAQPRVRAMSIEELEARHRAKLAALQAPATQTVHEADALRRAKEEWERKQKLERRRMQEREAQKQAAAAAASGASASGTRVASPVQGSHDLHRISSAGSRDDRRRSRNLSATLLEAVGEEAREVGGVNRAAEWRKSISGLDQLDPRAAKASNPATPISTRPTSPQPTSANPFPVQSTESRKRLSETDRRRLSQGAGDRSQRRYSQPLLDFNLPHRNQ